MSRKKGGREKKIGDSDLQTIKIFGDKLFDRVVSILEQAKSNVVKAVNSNMVIAYWLIGREIVEEIQQGEERAKYGEQIIENLSLQLTRRYGTGFSATNIKYFRLFFQTYNDREPAIRHSPSDELPKEGKLYTSSGAAQIGHEPGDVFNELRRAVNKRDEIKGFSPYLSWTHYRTLTGVEHKNERLFYEIEAEKERWSVSHLERQIHTPPFRQIIEKSGQGWSYGTGA